MKKCALDDEEMTPLFKQMVLGKYEAQYYRCPACGLIQTEDPYWLEEAYADAIVLADTGIMHRNLHDFIRVVSCLYALGVRNGTVVDIGGGYGILTRLLRDAGFDALWSDKYCQNIVARGFEAESGVESAEVLCAFEVMEHVHNPLEFFQSAIGRYMPRHILCSTELVSGVPDRDWWYYGFNAGQHVSLYSERAMHVLAGHCGMCYYRLPRNLHLFTKLPQKPVRRFLLQTYLLYFHAVWVLLRMRKFSRTVPDHEIFSGRRDVKERK